MTVQELLIGLTSAGGLGVLTWLGFVVRKFLLNWGKTEQQIRAARVERALKALEAAHATPDKADDLPAEQAAELAQQRLEWSQRLGALTDAVSSAPTKNP